MTEPKKHFRIIFITSIILLIVNDIFLKSYYSNYFTGKLSDIVGLFSFPYFLSLLLPKTVKFNYIGTAIFFIIWKSELIEPILIFFQNLGIGINRTVDYSDLITLIVLPISYRYWNSNFNDYIPNKFYLTPIILTLCSLSFIATSMPKEYKRINLKSNLEISLRAEDQDVITKLNLNKIYDSLQYYNYYFKLDKSNSEITSKVKITKLENGLLSIKLDSVLKSETKGNLFFGVSKKDLEYIDELTISDYERIFIEKGITKLFEK